MTQRIDSPERAKELLKDATPSPWTITTMEGIGGIGFAEEFYTDDPRDVANVALAEAAPELAESLANMRYEYAVQGLSDDGEWKFTDIDGKLLSSHDSEHISWWRDPIPQEDIEDRGPGWRIVRRLVSEVEVVE